MRARNASYRGWRGRSCDLGSGGCGGAGGGALGVEQEANEVGVLQHHSHVLPTWRHRARGKGVILGVNLSSLETNKSPCHQRAGAVLPP
jgi:hypothetical protein